MENKDYLSTAQINDTLYSRMYGDLVVVEILCDSILCNQASGHLKKKILVNYDGRHSSSDIEPTVFFRTIDNKYLTSRPEIWNYKDIRTGTEIYVWDADDPGDRKYSKKAIFLFYLNENKYPFFTCGKKEFENKKVDVSAAYRYCEVVTDENRHLYTGQ